MNVPKSHAIGPVSEAIRTRVLKQVEEHGAVVWFDPEKVYETIPDRLSKAGVNVFRFDGSVFELRKRIEPLLAEAERPRFVVYLPATDGALGAPLAEVIAAGVALRPGQQPVALNTRLSVIARAALVGVLPPEALDSVIRQIEGGQLGLGELDRLAEAGVNASTGTLSLLFGTSHPADIALQFLADPSRDARLVEKKAVGDLASLLSVEYGLATEHATSPEGLRDRLALLVLSTDLVSSIDEELPTSFKDLPRPERQDVATRLQELARTWRNRRDFQGSYEDRALRVERDLEIATLSLSMTTLARIETFRGLEEHLQDAVEAGLLADATPSLLALTEARLQGFWSSVVPELMDRWALVLAIGRVLVAADEVERELSQFPGKGDAAAFAAQYVGGEAASRAWADLDMSHRQMERRYHLFDVDVTDAHRAIERLVAKARARYATVASMLGSRFLGALQASKLVIAGVPRQAETFERFVRPALERGKVAYLLVDGLRYEMARELHSGIDREHDAELSFTLGTLPSITEVGMAALLPRADRGMELVAAGAGKVGIRLGGTLVRNRKERLDYFELHAGVKMHATRLEAILPPNKKTRDAITEAALVVVTATDELDGLCEAGNVAMARRLMDDVLLQVWRGLRVLFDLGVRTAIVTSDHGHLFGETLDAGATIDAPGGQTVDLHRRVWVGKGGASSDSYLRLRAADVGLRGDLELAVPWALAGFKAPGASAAYFHGGASPQELLVPVWTVTRKAGAHVASSGIAWRLTLGSTVISARFLSVQIDGSVAALFGAEPPLLRIEVRDGKAVLSRPVASSYGFEDATGFVQIKIDEIDGKTTVRPNTVTLLLETAPGGGTVEIVARDVATDRVVARLTDVLVKLAGF